MVEIATCDFPWSCEAIAECLDPGRRNFAIDGAIRGVTHLTSEGILGLQLAHTSLEFFIRQHAGYQNYASALEWLRTQAPDVLRWSYEWLLAAEGGDDEPLLRGPNRQWLIEGMARRYPAHIADRILTRSAWVALRRGKLDRFVELGLLSITSMKPRTRAITLWSRYSRPNLRSTKTRLFRTDA